MVDPKELGPGCTGNDAVGALRIRKFSVPALPEVASAVRFHAAKMAREIGFDSEQVGDIELSVGEAISNAIKYGCAHDSRSRVVIRFHQFSDKFVAEISDCGCGFDPVEMKCSPSEHLIEGGRGIHFIKSFMDEVSFTFCGGTTVRMTKLLRSSDERHACKNANSLDVG